MNKLVNDAIRHALAVYRRTRSLTSIDGVRHIELRRPHGNAVFSHQILPKGSVHARGGCPLPVDILVERNVQVRLRDGEVIYTDVFRPVGSAPVPAIVSWSPYGKTAALSRVAKAPIPLSGLQKFEAPDPAYWVSHGYAIIQPDIRGIGRSTGHFTQWGSQDGRDGYDLVEWIAAQDWSNQKVGFAGNSWLAMSQWFIGAEQPPHLAALAPWEGSADIYRSNLAPGGIPAPEFSDTVALMLAGEQPGEALGAMLDDHPLFDEYWHDKTADLGKIDVPVYAVASYTNKVHSRGTIAAFIEAATPDKWLRIHNTHEWQDFYPHQDDLLRFFDRYLKGIDNGWEHTPRVRLSVLDPGGTDTVDRPAESFPPPGVRAVKFFLADTGALSATPQVEEGSVSYQGDDGKSSASFTIRFDRETEIIGGWKLRLWVQAPDHDDIDIFLRGHKLDVHGQELPVTVYGAPYGDKNGEGIFEWGHGCLRASLRKLDHSESTDLRPYHSFDEEQKLTEGEIVPLDIEIPPMGMRWHPGEQLRIVVAGHTMQSPEFSFLPPTRTLNRGRTVLHVGEQYDSHLLVPVAE